MTLLVSVKNLCTWFPAGKGRTVKAVDNVTFDIREGETLGLVGESGCGKTTCGRTVLRLYHPTSGTVTFDGVDVASLSGKKLLAFKKDAQMIFQDPYSSLDPRMTIAELIREGMDVHYRLTGPDRIRRVNDLLQKVGLPQDFANRFPHELSGGQRQRVGIARALALEPRFIVCDEPISALDVSIQAQIVNLLIKLQREEKLTYLFISHDLSMVRHISDRVGIMYLGKLVELGPCDRVFEEALHPYTKALISAIPLAEPGSGGERVKLEGEVPSPINPPSGCAFRTRCRFAKPRCAEVMPQLEPAPGNRTVACHFWRKINGLENWKGDEKRD
ncbi:ABC transporter ATP-binding protein [Jonquetella anthropi]|uniref:ABC transporter ATP-binding protein n=1 Tax=Jonquetella anthropi TaxID=428712 RepID=UPI0023F3C193|nr:ABC transporter ATP-binding protein [Jonquetella anthropi]